MAESARHVIEHARRAGDVALENEGRGWLSGSYYQGPLSAAEAIRRCEELLAEVGEQSPIGEAVILGKLAGLRAMQGDFGQARADVERARTICADLGLAIELAERRLGGLRRA
jgi:hypothetical protein